LELLNADQVTESSLDIYCNYAEASRLKINMQIFSSCTTVNTECLHYKDRWLIL